MRRRATHAAIGLLVVMFAGTTGCEVMRRMDAAQEGWRTIPVGTVLRFRVPADARERTGQAVDSLAGLIEGRGYEITFDYGRFSEPVEAHRERAGYSVSEGRTGSRRMQKVFFQDVEDNPSLPLVRIMRVEDGRNAFTLRVSCVDEATCGFADTMFASVEFN